MKRTKSIDTFIQLANASIASANRKENEGEKESWETLYYFARNYLDILGIKYINIYAYWDSKEGKHIECDIEECRKHKGYLIFK